MESNADLGIETVVKLIQMSLWKKKSKVPEMQLRMQWWQKGTDDRRYDFSVNKISADFEKKVNDMLKKCQKQDDQMLTIQKEVSKQTKSVKHVCERTNC